MLTDAANIIFTFAKRRCYTMSAPTEKKVSDADDDQDWDVLNELEGRAKNLTSEASTSNRRPRWLPDGMEPVLEELPKWTLVGAALQEIEEEMIRRSTQVTFRRLTAKMFEYRF